MEFPQKEKQRASKVRSSNFYRKQYQMDFVDKWDELIDWEGRTQGEGDFFVNELKKQKATKILDSAAGTGYHSVRLLQAGFGVHSADGSANMLEKAFVNARKQGLLLRTIHADWRSLTETIHETYDAIICLGNSFTHLFDENERRKALAEFYSTLNPGGVLIVDHRNYDVMLDRGYHNKHKYYYVGENVQAEPEFIESELVRFRYRFADDSEYHLNLYPLRKDYTRSLIRETGFQEVSTYGDFQETYRQEDPDFFIHVAQK